MIGDRSAATSSARKRGISAGATKPACAIWCVAPAPFPGPLKLRTTSMASSVSRTAASPVQCTLTRIRCFSAFAIHRTRSGIEIKGSPQKQQPCRRVARYGVSMAAVRVVGTPSMNSLMKSGRTWRVR